MPNLLDIAEVRPVDETDLPCLMEVRDVLVRHGALTRFGVMLAHEHFPLGEDETLLEVCDPVKRTLTIRPGSAAEGADRFIGTNFLFADASSTDLEVMLQCKVGCFVDLRDRHRRTHDRVR